MCTACIGTLLFALLMAGCGGVKPVPPGESKSKDTRYLDIRGNDQLDEALFAAWVKQASQLPGREL